MRHGCAALLCGLVLFGCHATRSTPPEASSKTYLPASTCKAKVAGAVDQSWDCIVLADAPRGALAKVELRQVLFSHRRFNATFWLDEGAVAGREYDVGNAALIRGSLVAGGNGYVLDPLAHKGSARLRIDDARWRGRNGDVHGSLDATFVSLADERSTLHVTAEF